MTTIAGGNEVFRPTPIQFTAEYDVTKMRRLAADIVNLANRVASLAVVQASGALPSGGTTGQVLTRLAGGTAGWANPAAPTSFPYASLTGVPTSFAPAVHLIASPTGLGPAHSIQATAPSQVLKSTGTSTAQMAFLNYAELGDVNIAGLGDGQVPTWSAATTKWVMRAPSGVGGGTPGYIYTALSPTAAAFRPLSITATAFGKPTFAQWGIAPQPTMPMRDFAGTKQYAQLNLPAHLDSVLGGDLAFHPTADIDISWAQISNIPPQLSNLLPQGFQPAPGKGAFLRDDGTWQVVSGTGTVTSVALTMPGIFAVGGSPITGAGTLAVTLNTETANTVWAGPTTGGAATPTFRALVAADVPSSILPGGFTGFANPSALVALAAANGVATTAMRSDAAPALNVTISPTWTGNHTFTPVSGVALRANGVANSNTVFFVANSTSGQSFGPLIEGGTTSADYAMLVTNQSGATRFFRLVGDGSFNLGNNASTDTITGTATGAVTFNAPTTANSHTIKSANAVPLVIQSAAGADGRTTLRFTNPANTQTWDTGIDTSGGATLAWSIRNITTAGTPFSIGATTNRVDIGAPASGNFALQVTGVSGTTPVNIIPIAATDHAIRINGPAGGRATLDLAINAVDKAFLGINNAANDLITGSALNDLVIRAQAVNIDFSTDSGSNIALQLVAANAGVKVNAPTGANTSLTVAAIAAGQTSTLIVGGAAVTSALTATINNTSTVSGDTARISITAGANNVALYATNQNQATAIVTNGPTAQQAVLRTLTAIPLVFGTNNTYAGQIASGGAWQIPTSPQSATVTQMVTGVCAYKTSDTTSASNALTADAALTLTLNETGKYAIEIWLPFFEATVGTGGFQFDLGSGTAVVANLVMGVDGFSTASVINAGITSTTTATSAASIATSSTAPSWFFAKGSLSITTAGTLAIRWAQASTLVADPTTLKTGAYFKVTKVA